MAGNIYKNIYLVIFDYLNNNFIINSIYIPEIVKTVFKPFGNLVMNPGITISVNLKALLVMCFEKRLKILSEAIEELNLDIREREGKSQTR